MQATKPPSLDVDTGLLRRLEQALFSSAKRVLRRGGVGGPRPTAGGSRRMERTGYVALSTLEQHREMRLSELAAAIELDVSTVSRQVRLLEGWGLLERTPDPHDGRASLLGISAAGRDVLEEQRQERHAVLAQALHRWPAPDRQQLLALLERLNDSLVALACTPPPNARSEEQKGTS